MEFDYYYGDESNQFSFYRIHRQLITGENFKKLSTDAKLLYGLLLDRMGLSAKNGWYDEAGRVYIYYTLDEIQEDLNCGHEKAVRLLAELDTVPSWMYLYEMQSDRSDWSQPCLLGRHITGERFGTVLTASPLPLPPNGCVKLNPGDFDTGQGAERLTAAEFEAKYLDPNYQPPKQAVPHRPASRAKRSPHQVPSR